MTSDTTVLDIGAWVGPTSLYAAHRAHKVYAFEPDPLAFGELQENLKLNPDIKNVELVQACIAESNGELRMGAPGDAVGNSVSSILFSARETSWTVPAFRLGSFLRKSEIQSPLFVKVDVEGYEYSLLPSLLKDLTGYESTVYLSTHPQILWGTLPDGGAARRLRRRIAMIRAHVAMFNSLRSFGLLTDSNLQPLHWGRALPRIIRGGAISPDKSLVAANREIL